MAGIASLVDNERVHSFINVALTAGSGYLTYREFKKGNRLPGALLTCISLKLLSNINLKALSGQVTEYKKSTDELKKCVEDLTCQVAALAKTCEQYKLVAAHYMAIAKDLEPKLEHLTEEVGRLEKINLNLIGQISTLEGSASALSDLDGATLLAQKAAADGLAAARTNRDAVQSGLRAATMGANIAQKAQMMMALIEGPSLAAKVAKIKALHAASSA
ncbi:MAG: hypothetical protein P0S95_00455 [Rhabdochlamydiaceae bacterium]|nr:hypothetical protein [Candidatus Amphrikana amoebophyrae]